MLYLPRPIRELLNLDILSTHPSVPTIYHAINKGSNSKLNFQTGKLVSLILRDITITHDYLITSIHTHFYVYALYIRNNKKKTRSIFFNDKKKKIFISSYIYNFFFFMLIIIINKIDVCVRIYV